MYFKIKDKKSPSYERIIGYIEAREMYAAKNIREARKIIGKSFTTYLQGPRNGFALPLILGIVPDDKKIISIYGMKTTKANDGTIVFIPDMRCKQGRRIKKKLQGLNNWHEQEEVKLFKQKRLFNSEEIFRIIESNESYKGVDILARNGIIYCYVPAIYDIELNDEFELITAEEHQEAKKLPTNFTDEQPSVN